MWRATSVFQVEAPSKIPHEKKRREKAVRAVSPSMEAPLTAAESPAIAGSAAWCPRSRTVDALCVYFNARRGIAPFKARLEKLPMAAGRRRQHLIGQILAMGQPQRARAQLCATEGALELSISREQDISFRLRVTAVACSGSSNFDPSLERAAPLLLHQPADA